MLWNIRNHSPSDSITSQKTLKTYKLASWLYCLKNLTLIRTTCSIHDMQKIQSSLLYHITAMQVFGNLPGLRLIKSVQIFTQCGNYAFVLVGILSEYVLNHHDSLLYNIIYLNSKVIQYTPWDKVSISEVRNVCLYHCPCSFNPSMLKPSHLSKEMHQCFYTQWSS